MNDDLSITRDKVQEEIEWTVAYAYSKLCYTMPSVNNERIREYFEYIAHHSFRQGMNYELDQIRQTKKQKKNFYTTIFMIVDGQVEEYRINGYRVIHDVYSTVWGDHVDSLEYRVCRYKNGGSRELLLVNSKDTYKTKEEAEHVLSKMPKQK